MLQNLLLEVVMQLIEDMNKILISNVYATWALFFRG